MKKIAYFIMSAVALLSVTFTSCGKSESSQEQEVPKGVVVLQDDVMFRPDKAPAQTVVLDFNAEWCVPCKKLTPAYDMAAEAYEGKVAFYSVDFEKNPETAKAFDVTSVPTVIILGPDGSISKSVGLGDFVTPEQLQNTTDAAALNEIIYGNLKAMIDKTIK